MWLIGKKVRLVLKVRRCRNGFASRFISVQKLVDYLWLRKSGSEVSIANYCWHVTHFCLWAKINPDDILGKSREELETLVQKYLDEMRSRIMQRGPSPKTVNIALACLKTFFRVNGFNRENNQDLRLQSYHEPPRTRNRVQYVPTLSEACLMGERAGSRRNRAIIHTLFSTGLRNAALRAIRVKDVAREIKVGHQNLLIKVEPEWNKRIPGSCKGSVPYYTFTAAESTQAIKEMLEERKEKFCAIKEDEPLFISEGTRLRRRSSLSDGEEQEIVRNAAREARIEDWKHVTPHSLRKVFESVLRSPLKDGGRMDTKDQEFLMGHILPWTQDAYYDWTKINRLREEYSKLVFEETTSPELDNLRMYREMAKILGINHDEVKKKKQSELSRQLMPKEEIETLEAEIKSMITQSRENHGEQRIIRKEELQTYLDMGEGWKFLSVLDQQLVIVEKPLHKTDFSLAPLSNGTALKKEEHN
jgi:site-specific recombinase XerD